MAVTKVVSVPRASVLLFMTVLRRMRTIVPVTTMVASMVSSVVAIVPVRDRRVDTSLVRAVTSVRDKVAISVRAVTSLAKEVTSVKAKVVTSRVRVVISARVRKVVIRLVKVRAATSVKVRVDTNPIRSLMASLEVLIRKVPVSIRPTTIRMLSTA